MDFHKSDCWKWRVSSLLKTLSMRMVNPYLKDGEVNRIETGQLFVLFNRNLYIYSTILLYGEMLYTSRRKTLCYP